MMQDEIQNLILQVEGEQRLKELNKELLQEIKLMSDLKALFAGMPQQAAVFDQQMAISTAKLNALGAEILKVQEADAATGGEGGGFKFRGGMRADLILTHAFRSLASETTTLSEKLERLSMVTPWIANMFGIGGPWVMGLALGVTAVVELYTHWNDLMAALGNTAPRDAAKAIEEFAARAKTAIEEFKKAAGMPVGEEADITGAFKKMVEGPEADRLKAQLLLAIQAPGGGGAQPTGTERTFLELQKLTYESHPESRAAYAAKAAEISARINAENTAQAERLLSETHTGKTLEVREEARKRIALLSRGTALGAELQHLTPEGIAADEAASDAAEEAQAAGDQAWREHRVSQARKRREKAAAEAQDAADMDQARKMQMTADARKAQDARRFFDQQAAQQAHIDQVAERNRPLMQAQQAIRQEGRSQGIEFSDAQMLEGARRVLGDIGQQIDPRAAVLAEVQVLIQHMLAAQAANANRLGMGPDMNGQFSVASPWQPGW